jgi:DNA-binding NarL/FixJ family response regulator
MKYGRAVLADSHLNMLGGIHSLLAELFSVVLMAADERSLDDAITACEPELVIVDLSMPGEGRANIAARLVERHPGLRLIVLSVHDDPSVAAQVRRAGAAGFVLKRTATTDLPPAIHTVFRGGAYVSPAAREVLLGSTGR